MLIKQKTVIICSVIVAWCFSLVSCAQVAGNYPLRQKTAFEYDFPHIVFEGEGIIIIKNPLRMWFDVDKFLRINEETMTKLDESGLPLGRINMLKNSIYSFKKLEFEMAYESKDINPNYAFGRVGLVFKKNTFLKIKRGSFNITLISSSGEVKRVKDEGTLVKFSTDGFIRYEYIDSRDGEIEISWELQKPDYSKEPNIIYFRVPHEYSNWEISSITVDFDKLSVKKKVIVSQGK